MEDEMPNVPPPRVHLPRKTNPVFVMMEEDKTARIDLSARTTSEVFRISFNLRKAVVASSSNRSESSFADAAKKSLSDFTSRGVQDGKKPLPLRRSKAWQEYPDFGFAQPIFAREIKTLCGLISTSMSAPYLASLNLGHDFDYESNSNEGASYVIRALSFCSGLKKLKLRFTNEFYISFLACSERHIGTMQLTSLELGDAFVESLAGIDSDIVSYMSFFAAKKSGKHLMELDIPFKTAVPTYRAAVLEALGIMDSTEVKLFWESDNYIQPVRSLPDPRYLLSLYRPKDSFSQDSL